MKGLLLLLLMTAQGCTFIYVSGDNNDSAIGKDTDVSTDADIKADITPLP